jgi:hypothetical protein
MLPVSTTARLHCHANFITADRMEGSMTKLLGILGKSRCLVVPMLAIGVIAGVATAGVVESRAERATTCGLAITVQDPDLRASLVRFDRHQSPAARKICAFYRDRH